jgi:hypothetical protein
VFLFYFIRSSGKLCNFRKTADDQVIVVRVVGNEAVRTILDTFFSISEISAASLTERIEGTVTEKAVEPIRVRTGMAGKKFTFPVAEKAVVFLYHV